MPPINRVWLHFFGRYWLAERLKWFSKTGAAARFSQGVKPMLKKHCFKCHAHGFGRVTSEVGEKTNKLEDFCHHHLIEQWAHFDYYGVHARTPTAF